MFYREYKPSLLLDRWIDCLWCLETNLDESSVQRVVPDGHMEIILHAGEPFARFHGEHLQKQDRISFCGQLTRPLLLQTRARGRVFGIRFKPAGASALFAFPMSEITDQIVAIHALSPALHRELEDALDDPDSSAIITKLQDAIAHRLRTVQSSSVVEHALLQIKKSQGQYSIAELATECNMSLRQVERLFLEKVGLGPKMLSRLTRFQQALLRFDPRSNWADVAVDAGYYDQSHLVRDFRRFAGETPAFLISSQTDLAEHFTSRGKPPLP